MVLAGAENFITGILEQEALVIGIGGILLAAYYLIQKMNEDDMYEDKEPSEVTRELLKKELENGNKVKKKLKDKRQNSLISRGRILYELDDEMPGNPITPVIDPENDEGNDQGNVETEDLIWMYKVIPENQSFIKYLIQDVILGNDEVAEYYILDGGSLEIYKDEIVIQEGVYLDYERGIFTDRTDASKNKPNMLLRLASQTELVKGHLNFAPKVIFNDTGHAMKSDLIERSKNEEEEI